MSGADCSMDHQMLWPTIVFSVKKKHIKAEPQSPERFNTAKMKDGMVREKLEEETALALENWTTVWIMRDWKISRHWYLTPRSRFLKNQRGNIETGLTTMMKNDAMNRSILTSLGSVNTKVEGLSLQLSDSIQQHKLSYAQSTSGTDVVRKVSERVGRQISTSAAQQVKESWSLNTIVHDLVENGHTNDDIYDICDWI